MEADHSYKLGLQCGIRRTPMLFILIPDLPLFTGGEAAREMSVGISFLLVTNPQEAVQRGPARHLLDKIICSCADDSGYSEQHKSNSQALLLLLTFSI